MSDRAGKRLGCGEEVVFPGTFPRRTFHIGGRWVMYGTVTIHTKRAHITHQEWSHIIVCFLVVMSVILNFWGLWSPGQWTFLTRGWFSSPIKITLGSLKVDYSVQATLSDSVCVCVCPSVCLWGSRYHLCPLFCGLFHAEVGSFEWENFTKAAWQLRVVEVVCHLRTHSLCLLCLHQ